MHIAGTHGTHTHHHALPLAIAGATAIVATALLTGPVHLSFGGTDDPPDTSHPSLGVAGAAAATGRCVSSRHALPGDVPAPACRLGGISTAHVARTHAAAPVPCLTQFRATWAKDTARPAGCD